MKKITKKDKVESYLEDLMKTEGFTTENLMNTTVYDLFGNAELEGIGKTTLSGALNLFKKKYGLKKPGKGGLVPVKNTKKERVERYLTNLMKSPEFGVDDLMDLTVYDLFGNSELEGIGKTTLSSGISTFKKKYLKIQYSNESTGEETNSNSMETDDSHVITEESTVSTIDQIDEEVDEESEFQDDDEEEEEEEVLDSAVSDEKKDEDQSFEDVFISAIVKEEKKEDQKPKDVVKTAVKTNVKTTVKKKSEEQAEAEGVSLKILDADEIATLKNMISRFKTGQMNIMPMENFELIELKHALRHFGVDYKTILEHYRKNADK
ncbi:MAG: hypothetical protein HOE30_11540 [Deltaproteobacteria bacterium]|nr:hypothetical protein [Deltaproteobacteria bacterium]